MEVTNYKAYRVIPIDRESEFNIGEVIPMPQYRSDADVSERRKKWEDIFEKKRKSLCNNEPSRRATLFVFPYDQKYIDDWLSATYKSSESYVLLTLQLDGEVFWHNIDEYNQVVIMPDNEHHIEECAEKYWIDLGNDFSCIDSVEGLFRGTAKVINKEIKTFSPKNEPIK